MYRAIRGAAVAAIVVSLTACGSSTPEVTATMSPLDPEAAYQAYSDCMRENGANLPEQSASGGTVSVGGGDFDYGAFDEANAACDSLLGDAFGEFDLDPELQAEMKDQELKFAQCMRANGVEDYPDPDPDSPVMEVYNTSADPDGEAATDTCTDEVYGGQRPGGEVHVIDGGDGS